MLWQTDPIFIGSGLGATILQVPPKKVNPEKETVIAGPMRLAANVPFALPMSADEMIRRYGNRFYEAMLTDPSVSSSYLKLKLGILDGGISLLPNKRPPVYRRKAGEHQLNPDRIRDLTPEEQESAEAQELCQRAIDRIDNFDAWLIQWLDCMGYGCKLTEVTYDVVTEGMDKGLLTFRRLAVKPDWAWRFVVNSMLEVTGILTWSPQTCGFLVLAPQKFHWLTWLPKDGDPRGTSQLRAAAEWWNLKTQIKPFYYAHLKRWGSPSVDLEMAEGDTRTYPPLDCNGNIIPGAPSLSAEEHHRRELEKWENGSSLIHPSGSKLTVQEPKGQGEVFLEAFKMFDRQITMAICLAVAKAKKGKDEDTGADDEEGESLAKGYGRNLARCGIKGLLREFLTLNKGAEYADRNLPDVIVGETERKTLADLWNAGANLARAGYIGESQKPAFDAMLDLPERDAKADAEAQAAAQAANPATTPQKATKEAGDGPDSGKGKNDSEPA